MINWNVSNESWNDIIAIVHRIEADLKPTDDRRTIVMDITACHANGCPLRLKELLAANKADFSHDYYGIRQHINRETGMLENSFTPRYAAPEKRQQDIFESMLQEAQTVYDKNELAPGVHSGQAWKETPIGGVSVLLDGPIGNHKKPTALWYLNGNRIAYKRLVAQFKEQPV